MYLVLSLDLFYVSVTDLKDQRNGYQQRSLRVKMKTTVYLFSMMMKEIKRLLIYFPSMKEMNRVGDLFESKFMPFFLQSIFQLVSD